MLKALSIVGALALLTHTASAEDRWPEQDRDQRQGSSERSSDRTGWQDDRGPSRSWSERSDRGERADRREGFAGQMSGSGRPARFYMRNAQGSFSITCATGETMRACVDAATTLMERVGSMKGREEAKSQASVPPASSSSPTSR